jgi:hypothetical protein
LCRAGNQDRLAGAGSGAATGHGAGVSSAAAERAGGNVAAADPMVYANGVPLARSAQGNLFFHDFQPKTYRFKAQPYGTSANLVDTLQLAPGTQAYVQVQAVPNWEVGSTAWGASFAVLSMSRRRLSHICRR